MLEKFDFYEAEKWISKDVKKFQFDIYTAPSFFGLGFSIHLGRNMHAIILDVTFLRLSAYYFKNRDIT